MNDMQAQCWICPYCYDDRHHEPRTGCDPAALAQTVDDIRAKLTAIINRRVTVENRLLSMATGKEPLPDQAMCMELAKKLGIPDEHNGGGS